MGKEDGESGRSGAIRAISRHFRPKAGGPGSTDCKFAVQGPIRAQGVLE
jgi:hypothetical protein